MRVTRKHDHDDHREGRARRLRSIAAFAGCSDAELLRIDDLATEVHRPAGTVLQVAGRPLRQAAAVVRGEVFERAAGGRALVPRPLFGAELLTGDGTSPSTVVAATDVCLLVFGLSEIEELARLDGIRALADGARMPAPAAQASEPAVRVAHLPGLTAAVA
jgi:CRP-like cAMP-binding protein